MERAKTIWQCRFPRRLRSSFGWCLSTAPDFWPCKRRGEPRVVLCSAGRVTRILINDTSNTNALLAFRARSVPSQILFDPPKLSGNTVVISWHGTGTLQRGDLT